MDQLPILEEELLQEVSRMLKILSDPKRIAILYLLQERELNVTTIAQTLELEQSAVSHQLRTLKDARLVKATRDGKNIIYSQLDRHVFEILNQVIEHAREIAETSTELEEG